MGHYYSGILDIATDLAQVSGRFGVHIDQIEVDDLSILRREALDGDVIAKTDALRTFFDVESVSA